MHLTGLLGQKIAFFLLFPARSGQIEPVTRFSPPISSVKPFCMPKWAKNRKISWECPPWDLWMGFFHFFVSFGDEMGFSVQFDPPPPSRTLREHFANTSRTLREHSANTSRTLREHFANTSRTLLGQFWPFLQNLHFLGFFLGFFLEINHPKAILTENDCFWVFLVWIGPVLPKPLELKRVRPEKNLYSSWKFVGFGSQLVEISWIPVQSRALGWNHGILASKFSQTLAESTHVKNSIGGNGNFRPEPSFAPKKPDRFFEPSLWQNMCL